MEFQYPGLGYNQGLRNPGVQRFNYIHIAQRKQDFKVGSSVYTPTEISDADFTALKSLDQSNFYSEQDTYINLTEDKVDQQENGTKTNEEVALEEEEEEVA